MTLVYEAISTALDVDFLFKCFVLHFVLNPLAGNGALYKTSPWYRQYYYRYSRYGLLENNVTDFELVNQYIFIEKNVSILLHLFLFVQYFKRWFDVVYHLDTVGMLVKTSAWKTSFLVVMENVIDFTLVKQFIFITKTVTKL